MPCQRVLAPVTGAGPPQAAETATSRIPPGWSPASARSRPSCDWPARTCRHVQSLTEGRLSGRAADAWVAAGLGMLLYTVIAIPGYFLARRDLPAVGMFGVLAALTVPRSLLP